MTDALAWATVAAMLDAPAYALGYLLWRRRRRSRRLRARLAAYGHLAHAAL